MSGQSHQCRPQSPQVQQQDSAQAQGQCVEVTETDTPGGAQDAYGNAAAQDELAAEGGLSDAVRADLLASTSTMGAALARVPSIVTDARAAGSSVAAGSSTSLFGPISRAISTLDAVEGDLGSGRSTVSRALRSDLTAGSEPELVQAQAAQGALESALEASRSEVKAALSPGQYKGKPLPPCPGGSVRMMLTERVLTLPVVLSGIDVELAREAEDELSAGEEPPQAPPEAGEAQAVSLGTRGSGAATMDKPGDETSAWTGGLEAGVGSEGATLVARGSTEKVEGVPPRRAARKPFEEGGGGGRAEAPGDTVALDCDGEAGEVPMAAYEEAQRVREERREGESLRDAARRVGADPSIFPAREAPKEPLSSHDTTTRTGGLGIKDGAWVAEAQQSEATTTVHEDGEHVERKTHGLGGTLDEEGGSLTGTQTDSVERRDGTTSSRSDQVGVAIKEGEVATTLGTTTGSKGADGVERESSTSGTMTLQEDELGLAGSASSKATSENEDGEKRTDSQAIDGSVTLSDDGMAGQASGEIQRGKLSFKLSAGGEIELNAPQPTDDGRFVVTYKITRDLSAGGGLGPVDLETKGSEATTGRRVFDTYDDALAFQASGSAATAIDGTPQVDAMAAGSEHAESSSTEDTAGLNADFELIKLEAAIRSGRSKGIHLVKVDDTTVRVTLNIAEHLGASGGMSGAGIGGSVGTQDTMTNRVVLQIDLENPAGRVALNYVLDKQALPPGGGGYTVLTRTSTESGQDTQSASILGVSTGHGGTATSTTEQGGGEVTHEAGRTSQVTAGLDLPILGEVGPQGSLNHSHTLSQTERDGVKGTSTATSVIDDSGADSAATGLANALDEKRDMDLSGEAAGKWTVTTGYSPAQIEGFLRRVERGQVKAMEAAHRPVVDRLATALRSTTDPVRRQEAFNAYLKAGGATAMKQLRRHLSGGTTSDLKLEGSDLFTGAAGRHQLEADIAGYRSRLVAIARQEDAAEDASGARTTLAQQVRSSLEQQQDLQSALTSTDKYQEIPPAFRRELLSRCTSNIRTLQELLAEAQPTGAAGNAKLSPQEREIAAELAFRDRRRADLQEVREDCAAFRRRHEGPRSARVMLGGKTTLPFADDGPEAETYDRIDGFVESVDTAVWWAEKNYKDFQEGRENGDLEGALIDIKDTNRWYGKAIGRLQDALTFYGGVERRWRGKYPGYFD